MKKQVTIRCVWLYGLALGLILSLLVNIGQLVSSRTEQTLRLEGSYCVDASAPSPDMPYLVFDEQGHFCRYTQRDGILDQGVYAEVSPRQYALTGEAGSAGLVILEEDGIYDIAAGDPMEAVFLPKFSGVLVFFGNHKPDWAS